MRKGHNLQAVSKSVKPLKSYRKNNMTYVKKPLAVALGAAFLASSFAPLVSAEVNPFSAQQLSGGYDLAHYGKDGEGKCGEGKCGEGAGEAEKAHGEGSCGEKASGEGSCGEGEKAEGEGKCGEGEKAEGEGKCGEGKCGG
ncbi:MAG: putative low-complexity protein [Halieaceae bacterium]|jgi:uncharacterized low-complexity protein